MSGVQAGGLRNVCMLLVWCVRVLVTNEVWMLVCSWCVCMQLVWCVWLMRYECWYAAGVVCMTNEVWMLVCSWCVCMQLVWCVWLMRYECWYAAGVFVCCKRVCMQLVQGLCSAGVKCVCSLCEVCVFVFSWCEVCMQFVWGVHVCKMCTFACTCMQCMCIFVWSVYYILYRLLSCGHHMVCTIWLYISNIKIIIITHYWLCGWALQLSRMCVRDRLCTVCNPPDSRHGLQDL